MIAPMKHYSFPHFLFAIAVAVFALLFGFANGVFAADPAPTTPTPTNVTTPTWTWAVYTDEGGSQMRDYTVGWCTDLAFPQEGEGSCADNTAPVSLPGGVATTVSFTHSTELAEGTWYFRVRATDNATNASIWSTNGSVLIDTAAPTVTNVTSTAANGSYTVGASIPITVTFSEAVTVAESSGSTPTLPRLRLETGATDREVTYLSGTGTVTLTFTYTVQAGDISSDLNYVAVTSLTLNGGTINDAAGNAATLALPALDAAESLGKNKDIIIDTAAPTITTFDVSPVILNIANPAATISWDVSDTGGSTLDFVNLWRAPFDSDDAADPNDRVCDNGTKTGCVWTQLGSNITAPAGSTSWECDYSKTTIPTADDCPTDNPADGVWWYGMHVRDKAGNEVTETEAGRTVVKVVKDAAAPSAPSTPDLAAASDTGHSKTDNITSDTTPTFTGTAEANSTVTILRAGTAQTPTGSADGSGNWSITLNTQSTGTVTYTATATDTIGNTSGASGGLSVIIDTDAPGTPGTPVTTPNPTRSSQPTWDWTASTDTGGSGVAKYRVDWCTDDQFPISCKDNIRFIDVTDPPSFTHDDDGPLSDGTWYFRAFARDGAGNDSPWSDAGFVEVDSVCIPPVSGDWEITRNCVLTDKSYTIEGNVIIQSAGVLDMRGTTNILFDTSATRYVYVYLGGQIFQAGTAGFNK